MQIGIPRETKNEEYRVALRPKAVGELVKAGNRVRVEAGAGIGAGYSDEEYVAQGAELADSAESLYSGSELIVKVKEPQPGEYQYIKPHHLLFCYLHLAAEPDLTTALVNSGATAIAFETVTDKDGGLPLLAPMSQVAGRMAVQAGTRFLEREFGGAGILLCPIGNVRPGTVVVIGAGQVGRHAIAYAQGIGARVVVLDRSEKALARVRKSFGDKVEAVNSSIHPLQEYLPQADLVVGAVLVPGASAPKVLSRDDLKLIRERRVIVDVAIDQGGCFESSRPTTHDNPVYIDEGVLHYCVTNMPGVVPRTSAKALSMEILPYVKLIAGHGLEQACQLEPGLIDGINVQKGEIVLPALMEQSSS